MSIGKWSVWRRRGGGGSWGVERESEKERQTQSNSVAKLRWQLLGQFIKLRVNRSQGSLLHGILRPAAAL